MRVLVDVGNTNIKVTYGDITYIEKTAVILMNKSFFSFFKMIKKEDNLSISSVVHELDEIIVKEAYSKQIGIDFFISSEIKTGLKFEVDDPSKLGADLIALAKYLSSVSNNGIIVNMGTATTIIHVKNNVFKGAIITPGIMTMKESVFKKASKISDFELETDVKVSVGKNTKDALSIGILNGHSHMIKGLVGDVDKQADLYLSGGNAIFVNDLLKEYKYIKEATTKGIEMISKFVEGTNE